MSIYVKILIIMLIVFVLVVVFEIVYSRQIRKLKETMYNLENTLFHTSLDLKTLERTHMSSVISAGYETGMRYEIEHMKREQLEQKVRMQETTITVLSKLLTGLVLSKSAGYNEIAILDDTKLGSVKVVFNTVPHGHNIIANIPYDAVVSRKVKGFSKVYSVSVFVVNGNTSDVIELDLDKLDDVRIYKNNIKG